MNSQPSPDVAMVDARPLLAALRAVRKGDFGARLPLALTGIDGEVAEVFNDVMDSLEGSTNEIDRVSKVVGKEGKISQRASLSGTTGGWARRMDALNSLIADLVQPIVEVSRVIGAVAQGDLSKRMALEIDDLPLQGEFLQIGKTVNTMVDQLSSFASEVTRVAREVGTEGKLGGQAEVQGVAGTWKDLTDNVNFDGRQPDRPGAQHRRRDHGRGQGRPVAEDHRRRARAKSCELKNTINTMVDQLSSFAAEVTRVAREVGTEGKLGGQAEVPGRGRHLEGPDRQRQLMAANLTGQVRNIAEVTTAVANGDLSQKITVDARGEILELKNTINTMVDQLDARSPPK